MKKLLGVFFAILLLPIGAQAIPITIEITGNITSVSGSGVPSTIYAGSTFTGIYTYDSETVDSGGGHYLHNAPYGITVSMGGYEFKTAPGHVEQFEMWIANDWVTNGVADRYWVRSYENVFMPPSSSAIDWIGSVSWYLSDSTHTVLSSNALPVLSPVLTDWDHNVLEIWFW